ncbi:MAG: hypothetical protein BZ136_04935, partial [Methanosphaera sp. rholeuAM74]
MDIEDYVKKCIDKNESREEITKKLTGIITFYKDIPNSAAQQISESVIDEVLTTQTLTKGSASELLDYHESSVHMGEFGVGSRGKGDFYVHSKIAEIIKDTDCDSIVNPVAQDDGGVVKIDDKYYITTAIDGIHSRLSDYPFLAG